MVNWHFGIMQHSSCHVHCIAFVFVLLFMSSSDKESLLILDEMSQVEPVRISVGCSRPVSLVSVCRHLSMVTHLHFLAGPRLWLWSAILFFRKCFPSLR